MNRAIKATVRSAFRRHNVRFSRDGDTHFKQMTDHRQQPETTSPLSERDHFSKNLPVNRPDRQYRDVAGSYCRNMAATCSWSARFVWSRPVPHNIQGGFWMNGG